MDHVAVRDLGVALQPDAELLAHDGGAAVAAGEEIAAHGLGRAGLDDSQGRGDAGLVLHEILERHAPARVDQRVAQDGVAQHRLDHTWLTRIAGSRGWVPSLLARISARFSTTLG